MVLLPLEPESSASAYSAISANIKFIGQPRPRDSCGYPKFSSAWSADQISTAAPLLRSLSLPQANCLFRHTRILSFHPLNFTRRGLSEAERFA